MTKKKKKKKSKLTIIDPEFIKNNQYYIPGDNKKQEYKTNSWFDIVYQKEDKLLYKRTRKNKETVCLRAKSIKITPTDNQKKILLRWFDVYRRVYNFTIANMDKFFVNGRIIPDTKMRDMVLYDLLKLETNSILDNDISKSKILISSIRNAIKDVHKAYKSAMANKLAGNINHFRLRYKKKTNPNNTLVLEPEAFAKKKNGFAIKTLGEMKSSKPFGDINHECRLSYNSNTKKFILWKPYDKKTTTNDYKHKIIALDPGLRSFQNGYSPTGICYKFATAKTNIKIKTIIDKVDNVKSIPKRNKNKYLKRLRKKATNMVTDLHWKVAHYLCKRFKTIIVGNMSTTGIVRKDNHALTPLNKKYCIQLSHYKFRERLISKAEENNVTCLIVDESYTTQTCGKCGIRNLTVGSSEVFKCTDEKCSFKCDRDYNAGRNIYLKALSNGLV